MVDRPQGKQLLGLVAVAALALLTVAFVVWPDGGEREPLEPPSAPPTPAARLDEPPPLSASPFRNVSPDAQYVGRAACAECHQDEHATYLLTSHSRALSDLDEKNEPADGAFQHAASGRHYRVYRDGSAFRHRESLQNSEGVELASVDHAMRYLIGSGAHSRSYLAVLDGFLVESPVTWYVDRKEWGVSPGYDRPRHFGFERATGVGCLFCHVGHVEPEAESLHRITVHEKVIGCERCHGPGSLHVSERRRQEPLAGEADFSIAHPGRMSRELGEAICAQCHLRGDATVLVRGRRLTDFRPGLPLTDVRVDYRLADGDSGMTVVGHVEQLRLSRCYTQTKTLTCTTCHDPHADLGDEQKQLAYRNQCLDCHSGDDGCRLPAAGERRRGVGDRCADCHMPQTPTDIPHIAFTHHQIGIHQELAPPAQAGIVGTLVAQGDVAHLSLLDQQRNLGLAYLELSARQHTREAFEAYRRRAMDLLQKATAQGLVDPDVDAALARVAWESDPAAAFQLANSAADHPGVSTRSLVNALYIAAEGSLENGNLPEAVQRLERLVRLRRNSEDYLLLAVCLARAGRLDDAEQRARQAISINPFRPDFHQFLAELYAQQGLTHKVAEQQEAARQLHRAGMPE